MAKNQSEQDHLIQAITRLMRPLVRFLLSRGFTYTRFIQILRPLYVEIAELDHPSEDRKKLTDSRISLLTGIARRYVKDLRKGETPAKVEMLKSPPNTRLIAEWLTNQRYLTGQGKPIILPRFTSSDAMPSFEELALSVTSDIKPRTLLDDLVERDLVHIEGNQITLKTIAYKPDKSLNELIDYFGLHMHDHMAAATNNLHSDKLPMFERSAFMDDLSEESIAELKQFSDQEAMKALKSVYAYAAELYEKDKSNPKSTQRFRMGVYTYHEDEAED
ncbi:MAG: hypothetical protein KTR18_09195 [Acidiferrobacterales bacterium]|nr:hypothetical protein [Acidiferrobacterales bacterium]